MNIFKVIYARAFQQIMRGAAYFLNFSRPITVNTGDVGMTLVEICQKHRYDRVLVVTDPGIVKIGLLQPIEAKVRAKNIHVALYGKTVANPTIDNIEEALALYKEEKCQALIAFGGGSAIDCAKGVYARLARPKKTITQLRGLLKVGGRNTKLIAIPTTSGTGSEATLAAVITDSRSHEKYAINDPHLIPSYAVLDYNLTLGLPPHITASTGMDAMTHAVEAYIGHANTGHTRRSARLAVKLIYENILEAYNHPGSVKARRAMQTAA